MAWGVMYPNGMGDFLPEGTGFEDQVSKLSEVFNKKMTDAERAAFNNRFARFKSTVATKLREGGAVLEDHEKPTRLLMSRMPRALGSIFWIPGGVIIVEQTVRDIIEEIEPGLHQLWQIELRRPRGKTDGRVWNVLVIGQSCAAFHRDTCDPSALVFANDQRVIFKPTKKSFAALALDAEAIGGRHLWRDPTVINPNFFVSDRLIAKLKNEGLRLPKCLQIQET